MLLSIGMIVKNEEKNLRMCLNGIKPILEQVDSELIIADTGSTDGTVEIAKAFTDKVYSIEWRDDFAWARNTTVDRARGGWYMFLDADEVFQDVLDIVKFFNSGEYSSYGSATHEMTVLAGEESSVFTPLRLFRLNRDTRFEGRIHEHPVNTLPPVKALNSVSVHSGYRYGGAAKDAARKRMKFERNIKPLLAMYGENPRDVRIITQIAIEYSFNKKTAEFLKFLDTGLSLAAKDPDDVYYHYLRLLRAEHYKKTEMYDEAVADVRDYFSGLKTLYTLAIDMRVIEAKSLKELGRPDEAAAAFEQAWRLYGEDDRGRIDHTDLQISVSRTLTEGARNAVAAELAAYHAAAGDIENTLAWGERTVAGRAGAVELYVQEQAENIRESRYEKAAELLDFLAERYGEGSPEYAAGTEAVEKALQNDEDRRWLAFAVRADKYTNDYVNLQILRKKALYGEAGETDRLLAYFLDADRVFSWVYGGVAVCAMMRGADISKLIDNMNVNDIALAAEGVTRVNDGLAGLVAGYVRERAGHGAISLKACRFLCALLRALLARGAKDEDEIITAFDAYAIVSSDYLNRVYNPDILTDGLYELMPEADRFAYLVVMACEWKDKGDYLRFAAVLKEAVGVDASMSGSVMTVIGRLQRALYEENKKARQRREELERETAALKKVIIGLINNNEKKQAAEILSGYEQINPDDPEIAAIRRML